MLDARLQGPAQVVVPRRMMLGIKQHAEGTGSPAASDVLVPLPWLAAAAAAGLHAVRALRDPGRPGEVASAGIAAVLAPVAAPVVSQVVAFWDVHAKERARVVTGRAGSELLPSRRRGTR